MKTVICLFLIFYTSTLAAENLNLVSARDEEMLHALLSLSLEELVETKVETAGKIAEKIGEIPASVVLLTRQDIQRYGYTSLTEILQHVPGLYEIDYYGLGGVLHGVRGYVSTAGSNRSLIILINGINQVADYGASYLLPAVPVEAIDRIEIVRGPLSIVYGSGAFFGAINIITNEIPVNDPGLTTQVSLQGGSRKTHQWFGRIRYAHPDGHFVLNAGTGRTNGLTIPYRQLQSQPRGMEANLTTEGRLENQESYIGFSATYQDFSFDMTKNTGVREGFLTQPTINEGTMYRLDVTHWRMGYQKNLTPTLSINGQFTYTGHDVDITFDSVYPNMSGLQSINSTAYEGEMNLWWKPLPTMDLTTGLYYRYIPNIVTYLDIPSIPVASLHRATQQLGEGEALTIAAGFAQFNYYPSPRWKWTAGLRLEQMSGYAAFAEQGNQTSEYQRFTPYYPEQDLAVIPRLAVIYTPHERHIFKWLYGKAINSPSFGQNTTARLTSNLPALEAEEIETLEFDYLTYLSPHHLLNINLFHNHLNKLLTRVITLTPSGQYTNFLGNAGQLTTQGIEISLQSQPTAQLQLELNMTYQHTEDHQHSERTVSYSPPWLGQFKLNYQWTPQVSAGMTGYYVSDLDSYFDDTLKNAAGSYGRRIGAAGGDFVVVNANLRFEKKWLTTGVFVNVHVYNLFDREIHYPTFPANNWADKGTFGWDRSVMVSTGYEF